MATQVQRDTVPSTVTATTETNADKVDQITALQDAVDSLSLSMFEALRGLRDAVAPESGNLGGNSENNANNDSAEPDFEDFWQSYRNGDPETVAMVERASAVPPQKREDYIRIHAKVEMEKDAALVKKLASTVLEKSVDIDERVSSLPGMHRTKAEQMKLIEQLLHENQEAATQLEAAYDKAKQKREQARKFVRDNTCEALGIIDDSCST
eukprot:Nitzschia sp. Nitz4//scaffold9_size221794//93176//93995//NITZ4_001346-RA/size221794-processed-gene-0.56-mRNA-1//-1//CDS//3329561001//4880//frame0